MTIKKKLFLSLLLLIIVPILFFNFYIYGNIRKNTIDSFMNKLEYISFLKSDKIDTFLNDRIIDLTITKSFSIIKNAIPILEKYNVDLNNPEYLIYLTVSTGIDNQLSVIKNRYKKQMVLLFNANGVLLYQNNFGISKDGLERYIQQYGPRIFAAGCKDTYLSDIKLIGQETSQFVMAAAAPLYEDRDFVGVVALVINLDDLFGYLQDPLQLGQGWETVIGQKLDAEHLIITQIQQGARKEPPWEMSLPGKLAEPLQKALQGETGAGLGTDHRGQPVIAAWHYLPRWQWGLVTKIDLAAALAPLKWLRLQVLLLGGAALILGILLALYLSRSIYQPIEALRRGVEIIGKGDLDHRLGWEGTDEISHLARAFDNMTARLRASLVSQDELAREVVDRQRAEKLAQKAEQEKHLILNVMSELVTYQDLDHRIIWANRAAGESLNLAPERMAGRHCYELWHSRQEPCPDCPVARAGLTGCIQEGEVTTSDNKIWLLHAYPVKDEHGVLVGVVEVIRNITERRRSEAALRRSAKDFHTLVNNLPAVVFKGYIDGAIDFYDDRIEGMLGYSREDFSSRRLKWLDLILPEDMDGVKQAFIKALKGDKSYVREYRIRNREGEVLWVQERSHIFCHPDGKVDYVSGVFYDITEQTQLQQTLQEQYHFVQTLLNTIPHPIFYKDIKGIYLGCNQAFEDFVGLPSESKQGKTVFDLYTQDQADLHHQKDTELFKHPGVQVYETSLTNKDGSRREVVVQKATFNNLQGELAGLIGVMVDITDLKRAQQALEDERRRLLSVLAELPAVIYLLGKDHTIRFANRLFQKKFGESGEKRCYELLHHRHDPCPGCVAFQVFETQDLVEKELSLPGGQTIQVYYYPFVDTDGSPLVLVMGMDVTERQRIEAEVRRAHEEVTQVLAALPSLLIGLSPEGCLIQLNPAAEAILGVKAADVLGQSLCDTVFKWDWDKVNEGLEACRREGHVVRVDSVWFRRPDGRDGFLGLTISPVRTEADSLGLLIVGADITERRFLEAQLAQAQKLESIGQLAAGIAHEINTPIQYVGNNIRFLHEAFDDLVKLNQEFQVLVEAGKLGELTDELLQKVDEAMTSADLEYLNAEVPQAIDQTLEGVERVARIVRAMKDFSHPGVAEKTPTDLNKAIDSTVTVARNEWKYVAEVVTDLDPALPLVPCLPGEFNQVVLNLIINAAHAIEEVVNREAGEKGTITLSTRRNEDWAEIRVKDSGKGIPPEIRDKIFDPFFTTKEVGKGTGQGLAIAYSVIRDKHRGEIGFESEVGRGTEFIIRLPLDS